MSVGSQCDWFCCFVFVFIGASGEFALTDIKR